MLQGLLLERGNIKSSQLFMVTAANYSALLFRKYLNNKWIFQNNSFGDLNLLFPRWLRASHPHPPSIKFGSTESAKAIGKPNWGFGGVRERRSATDKHTLVSAWSVFPGRRCKENRPFKTAAERSGWVQEWSIHHISLFSTHKNGASFSSDLSSDDSAPSRPPQTETPASLLPPLCGLIQGHTERKAKKGSESQLYIQCTHIRQFVTVKNHLFLSITILRGQIIASVQHKTSI